MDVSSVSARTPLAIRYSILQSDVLMPRTLKASEPILTDLSDAALAEACELNPTEWRKLWAPLAGQEVHVDRDCAWFASAARGRINAVGCARFTPATATPRIREILARYRELGVGASWWVGPISAPTDLDERLRAHGLRCARHYPGMALELARLPDVPVPAELRIAPIEDFSVFESERHPFVAMMYKGDQPGLLEGLALTQKRAPQRVVNFVATTGGSPLGAATLVIGAGVAGLYDVGVVREARRRGIGAAISCAALAHARSLGVRAAVLQSSSAGLPLYEKLGFRTVCRMSHWYYSKERQAKDRGRRG